jgi:hypothetical protein
MRILLRSFFVLDLISLYLMALQIVQVVKNLEEVQQRLPSEVLQAYSLFPMFILIAAGAVGLAMLKKFGLVLYYIQFPFRLYFWMFTLGFITLIPEALENYDGQYLAPLIKICFAAEAVRLYLTIRAHSRFNFWR